ncbi:MAG: pantetheine-phosphate adenylyltransferase [Candidatus Geothermincolia bacterium]
MVTAVCPGTFDPITSGHLDVITRAAPFFGHVIVAVSANPLKNPMFTLEQRMELIRRAVAAHGQLDNVSVDRFEGLLVDYARMKKVTAIIKGLRAISDFEYEFQMAQINHKMDQNLETFFVMANPEYSFLSSSAVRELVFYGGAIEGLVPASIEKDIMKAASNK